MSPQEPARETERARERREHTLSPAGLPSEPPDPVRPPRPVGVEIAAALLITTGAISTLTTAEATLALLARNDASLPLALVSFAIGVGSVILGILVRTGRAWLVAVNVAAIAGFLEITSGTIPGFVFGGMDVLVVLLLMRHRPWFFWTDGSEDDEPDDDA